ncbi:MAG: hypothetical protein LQ350_005684, partial [Teloschistes chrysophthalmus]
RMVEMPTEVSPQLNLSHVSGSEHDPSHDPPHLSRSPQPYSKYRPDSPLITHRTTESYVDKSTDLPRPNHDAASKDFFDPDNRKRRKGPKSQSDSGTEADDESGPILKSLPAPPARLRKGLKDDSKLGISSPLLTPSYLDEITRREVFEPQLNRRGSAQSLASTDEEKVQVRIKFVKRRRAELLRRTTETFLLFSVGFHVTLNIVLGIASMPRAIIPVQDSHSGHTSVQWLLSIIPIRFLSRTGIDVDNTGIPLGITSEILALVYPLHQALLPTLGYLTTTSLLPAELQLLSVSLINLLLSSSSPQSLILQAILWIGGSSLFVFCRQVLEWEVALARIPTWRFRRNGRESRSHLSYSHVLKRLLKGRLSYATLAGDASENSDSDEPQEHITKQIQKNSRAATLFGNEFDGKLAKTRTMTLTSTTDAFMQQWPMKIDGASSTNHNEPRRHRSLTLPSSVVSLPKRSTPGKGEDLDHTLLPLTIPKSFRSLTKPQASVVKWLYALYTYIVAIFIIGVPIRSYVSKYALAGREPIGWALGYLFGDNFNFCWLVAQARLERWVALAQYQSPEESVNGRAEVIRWQLLGAANTRLLICTYCAITIGLGLATVLQLKSFADVDTRRKVFHGMMVVMFLPTIFIDPSFVALALVLVLAIFLLLDLFRASQLPPLSRPLTNFLAPYVDGRDHRGPVIVSHIFLLIGCSIPLWLSLASVNRSGDAPWEGWEVPVRDLSMISGVVCVGMGDAAASLIGRRYGRRRWCWSGGKSLEGSGAFAVAVMVGLSVARLWLLYGGWSGANGDSWPTFLCKIGVAASGASLTEAVLTGGNDNVIVPVILWLLVRGLEI